MLLVSAVLRLLPLTINIRKKKAFDGLTSMQFPVESVGHVMTLGVVTTTHTTGVLLDSRVHYPITSQYVAVALCTTQN
jgi:hypothetical protein